ncbi:MAG TPA: hypothetical protein VJS92_07655, partial [Candidatus Polarisedimenticolaceae bacterium]|nr:hypothetical protein [Candidatus Polarisedimenticolaceae bacterium]
MDELYRAILALDRPPGPAVRALRLGDWALRLEGLDAELLATLERRWGAFLQPAGGDPPRATLRLHRADAPRFLTRTPAGELYRVEARNAAEERVIVSYHFAVVAEDRGRVFRLALAAQAEEPAGRVVENAVRVIAARLAAEDGGFALHAGGVLRGGRAYLLAGPSGAGKTTAV